jgi:Cu2+-exporting ATPase
MLVAQMIASGASEEQLLSAAAAVEAGSDHPLAQAILRRAASVKAPRATGFKNVEGKGAQAEIDGKTLLRIPRIAAMDSD